MTDLETTPIVPEETKTVVPETIKPIVTESTVRNPDKLLERYEAQKAELAELKKYKSTKDAELSASEQERLKKEQQYEALVPLKIEEALKPYLAQVKTFESDKATLTTKLAESEKKYNDLQSLLKTNSLQESLYSEFIAQKGDGTLVDKSALWKIYGDGVKLSSEGDPIELDKLMETIKGTTLGAKLFTVVSPVGSGTTQTKATQMKTDSDKPRVVTQEMLLNPRKHGINTKDITSGKIVVEG